MNRITTRLTALALCTAFSTAGAEVLTEESYKARKDTITSQYKSDRLACDAMEGNQKDVCIAEAKGKEKATRAELEASYKPSPRAHYLAVAARAEADYAVAKERCDDLKGDAKKTCLKDAKATEDAVKKDAKAQSEAAGAATR